MRLLVLTQTVDRKDSSLGFFHNWIQALAASFEQITVFALRVGEHNLPGNVTVIPLRPWGYRAPLRTALRVVLFAWTRRNDYDAVFVHMNQEYPLVAGWLWKLLGKPVYMWRNHYAGTVLTDIAALFCDKIFYTSKSSYTAKYTKAVQMPVGVDVGSCHLDESIERKPHSILFLGRFDISKHPELLIEVLGKIEKEKIEFTATFVGGPSDPASTLPQEVRARAEALGIADKVHFVGAVSNTDTYRYYRSHAMYFNGGKSGMLDKSLFKAIACGCLPIFTSADMAEIIGTEFAYSDGDVESLAACMKKALSLSEEVRAVRVLEFEKKAVGAHALPVLVRRLVEEMQ